MNRACAMVLVLGLASGVAHGVPAANAPILVTQPNGATFAAVIRGDEYRGWMETLDGATVIRNRRTKFFEYAELRGNALVASGVAVPPAGEITTAAVTAARDRSKRVLPPRNLHLLASQSRWIRLLKERRPARAAKAPGPAASPSITGTWAPRDVSGDKKLLVILVAFKDAPLQPNAQEHWQKAFFGMKEASVARFYSDNSHGRVQLVPVPLTKPGTPPGLVEVSLPEDHPNCQDKCGYQDEMAFVSRVLAAAAPSVNFAALDANKDGTISVDEAAIYLVMAGFDASISGDTPSIWAHRLDGDEVRVAGKKLEAWAWNGERHDKMNRLGIGTVVHELGHLMFGLPDLYELDDVNGGLGHFSAMSRGSWGAKAGEVIGTTPVALDAWSRHYLGWAHPRLPGDGDTVTLQSGLSDPGSTVLLWNPGENNTEYWLVENRYPEGWDEGLINYISGWGGGALIQHIDANAPGGNEFNKYQNGGHQGNTVVEPSSAKCHLLVPDWKTCPTLFYYTGHADAYDAGSRPASSFYDGKASGLGITAISGPGPKMQAKIHSKH